MRKEKYNPPYTVSEEAVNLIAEISSAIERYKGDSQKKNVGVNVGVKLSARERDLIELIRLDGSLTAARIAETYSISTRQAERLLTSLKKKGFIVREGSDKTGLWVVKER